MLKRKSKKVISLLLCTVILSGILAVAPVTAHAATYTLHAWFSKTGMGEEAKDYTVRNRYYLCYELLDEYGRNIDDTGSYDFSVEEKIYDEFGETHCEYTYDNGGNWISFIPYRACRYYGKVTVSGYVGITVDLDFYASYNASFLASPPSLSLDIDSNNETELRFTPSGGYPGKFSVGWDHDRSLLDINFEKWENDTAVLKVKALKQGSSVITCSINEKYTGSDDIVAEVKVPVTVYSSKYTDTDFELTSTNNLSSQQEVALEITEIQNIAGYYWGTSSDYNNDQFVEVTYVDIGTAHGYTDRWQNVSRPGTYYATLKFNNGSISQTKSITFNKSVFDAAGGTVTPEEVITEKGRGFVPPTPKRDGYRFLGWQTVYGSTISNNYLTPTELSYFTAKWEVLPTEPSETVPVTTEPPTTAPVTTEPVTTTPSTTAPVTTVPVTTEPVTTASPETEPVNASSFSAGSASGKAGDTVDVDINVKNNPGITALRLEIGYSSQDLELIEIADNSLFDSPVFYSQSMTDNPVVISWYSSKSAEVWENGSFATLRFRIKEGAKTSQVTLSYDPENVFDSQFTNKSFSVENGTVTVEETLPDNSGKFVVKSGINEAEGLVNVDIDIEDNPSITAFQWEIGYSASELELLEIVDNGILDSPITYSKSLSDNPQIISWFSSKSADTNTNGKVATLRFKIKENKKYTGVTLSYQKDNVFNSRLENADFKIVYRDAPSVLVGDVNGDGVVNITDATTVQKHIAQLIELEGDCLKSADANGDGAVNIADATQIQKYIAQLIDYLG